MKNKSLLQTFLLKLYLVALYLVTRAATVFFRGLTESRRRSTSVFLALIKSSGGIGSYKFALYPLSTLPSKGTNEWAGRRVPA